MDRFSEESAADLIRSYRRNSRCFRDEDGIPDGEYEPLYLPEEDYATPQEPLCSTGQDIAARHWGSISEYLRAMEFHRGICLVCGGPEAGRKVARKPPASELVPFAPQKTKGVA